ncbi:MAG: methyltransferase domain-containing protein [Candidatus Omnitrophota bacterium]
MAIAKPFSRIYYLPLLFRIWLARVKAAYLDKKLGIEAKEDKSPVTWGSSGNSPYQPTPYGRLEKTMRFLKPSGEDVFVDLGCGKGRAVFFAATHKFKKVIGVEINKKLYDVALQNAGKLKFQGSPSEFINSNAADFDPKEGTVFFMYNPFGAPTLKKVLSNIKDSLASNPRKIRIVYYTPCLRHLLDEQDWLVLIGKVENKFCLVWGNMTPKREKPKALDPNKGR